VVGSALALSLASLPTRRSSDLLAVGDTLKGGQRPKLEDYGEIRFLVLRSATPAGDLADSYVFAGKDFVICLHHDEAGAGLDRRRSEEHTSELQSRFDLVCRLLL